MAKVWPDLARAKAALGALFDAGQLVGFFVEPVGPEFTAQSRERLVAAGFSRAGLVPERWEREGVRISHDELASIFPEFNPRTDLREIRPRRRERQREEVVLAGDPGLSDELAFQRDSLTGVGAAELDRARFDELAQSRIVLVDPAGEISVSEALREEVALACGENASSELVDYQLVKMAERAHQVLAETDRFVVFGVGERRFNPPIQFVRDALQAEMDGFDRLQALAAERDANASHSGAGALAAPQGEDDDEPTRGYRQAIRRRAPEDRIEDFGEKIGGARKDLRGKRFDAALLQTMTDKEVLDALRLPNLWPFSWNEARERGMEPEAAAWIYTFRRSLKPFDKSIGYTAFGDPYDENRLRVAAERYIHAIGRIRDEFETITEVAHLQEAASRLHQEFVDAGEIVKEQEGPYTAIRYRSWLPQVISVVAENSRCGFSVAHGRSWGVEYAARKLGLKQFGFGAPDPVDDDAKWKALLGRAARTRQKKSDGPTIPARPHLDELRFEGLETSRRGDATPEEFVEHFGFRGVEFGEWLPQSERQVVLNRAWDALDSLAQVMGVEARWMSLHGRLAAAFGSRGAGRAAAHYEPDRKVFNLTRLKGAGALAHEYGHAFDHWLADTIRSVLPREVGKVTYLSEVPGFASASSRVIDEAEELRLVEQRSARAAEGACNHREPAAIRVLAAMARTVRAFTLAQTEQDFAALADSFERDSQKHLTWARNWVGNAAFMGKLHKDYRARYEAAEAVIESAIEAHRLDADAMFRRNEIAAESFDSQRASDDLIKRLARMGFPASRSSKVCNALRANLAAAARHGLMAEFCLLSPEEREVVAALPGSHLFSELMKPAVINSQFMSEAEKLDGKRSKPYWATGRELFARTFEAWVFDRLAQMNARSEYLVHSVEADRFDGADYAGNPYPVSPEREEIGERFDQLMEVVPAVVGSPAVTVAPLKRAATLGL